MHYLFLRFPEGKEKAMTFSYDDGSKYDKQLIDILNRNGLKATLNVNSNSIKKDDNWHLNIEELKSLAESGNHEIAIHGAHHIALGKASAALGINDVLTCRITLERELKTVVRGMAYADTGISKECFGITKEEIKTYLKQLGIAYARTLGGDNDSFLLPEDFLEWMPTAKSTNPHLTEYLDKFINFKMPDYIACRMPRLFYVWGHSFEFDKDNGWERFEGFAKRAGRHEDIWYATNIEICDYVNAFKQLVFSVDGDYVYNPTCRKIWFTIDKKEYSVEPGETKAI